MLNLTLVAHLKLSGESLKRSFKKGSVNVTSPHKGGDFPPTSPQMKSLKIQTGSGIHGPTSPHYPFSREIVCQGKSLSAYLPLCVFSRLTFPQKGEVGGNWGYQTRMNTGKMTLYKRGKVGGSVGGSGPQKGKLGTFSLYRGTGHVD